MSLIRITSVLAIAMATITLRPLHSGFSTPVVAADDGGDGGDGGGGTGEGDGDGNGDNGEGDPTGDGDPTADDPSTEQGIVDGFMDPDPEFDPDPLDMMAAATNVGVEAQTVGQAVSDAAKAAGVDPAMADALGMVAAQAMQSSLDQGKSVEQGAKAAAQEIGTFARDVGLSLDQGQLQGIAIAIDVSTSQFGGA